jgi:hypothetical protein
LAADRKVDFRALRALVGNALLLRVSTDSAMPRVGRSGLACAALDQSGIPRRLERHAERQASCADPFASCTHPDPGGRCDGRSNRVHCSTSRLGRACRSLAWWRRARRRLARRRLAWGRMAWRWRLRLPSRTLRLPLWRLPILRGLCTLSELLWLPRLLRHLSVAGLHTNPGLRACSLCAVPAAAGAAAMSGRFRDRDRGLLPRTAARSSAATCSAATGGTTVSGARAGLTLQLLSAISQRTPAGASGARGAQGDERC